MKKKYINWIRLTGELEEKKKKKAKIVHSFRVLKIGARLFEHSLWP